MRRKQIWALRAAVTLLLAVLVFVLLAWNMRGIGISAVAAVAIGAWIWAVAGPVMAELDNL